jgi:hypothetical protein
MWTRLPASGAKRSGVALTLIIRTAEAITACWRPRRTTPIVEIQRVEHESRVHIDIETDDIPAEVGRLEKLGAKVVNRLKRWVVMQAPTGQRFCVVRIQRPGFPKNANRWD